LFLSSRRRHTRSKRDWSSDVCSSDLIYLGVPGPASVAHLLRISARIGVGASTRVLRHHGTGLLRLAQPGTWKPDPLLWSLAPMFAEPANGPAGRHIYPFNALRVTARGR